jgi:hypothetical protein
MDFAAFFQRLNNLTFNPLLDLLSAGCFLGGVVLTIQGLLKMAHSSCHGKPASSSVIVGYFFLGAVLISITVMMDVMTETFFGYPSSVYRSPGLAYRTGDTSLDRNLSAGAQGLFRFSYVVGCIAFIRGWFVLRSALQGRGHASFSGGVTHIVGGIGCINLSSLVDALQQTFGFKLFVIIPLQTRKILLVSLD